MSKYLITGGGGFLGSVLIDHLLANGHQVRVLDNLFRQSDYLISRCSNSNFEFVYGDILDQDIVKKCFKGVDGVVHLAALVGEPICKRMYGLASLVNIEGTHNVFVCKPQDMPMIMASTGSVYGKVEGICTENSPLNALSHYAKTKIACEHMVRRDAVIYRFSTAFGISGNMRVDLLVNDLVYRAIHDRALVMFQSEFRRSFVHCRDIASAIEFGLLNYDKMKCQTFNVGNPAGNWTKRKLAEYLKEKTGCFVAYADQGYVDTDGRDYEIDFSRMSDLGWNSQVSMEQGIDELISSMDLVRIVHRFM